MSNSRRRILYVIPSLRTGGAEKHVVSVTSHIDRARFEPHVVALQSTGDLWLRLAEDCIPVHALTERTGNPSAWVRLIAHLIGILHLVRMLRRLRPDVLHAYLPVPNIYAAVGKLLYGHGTKLVVSKRASTAYKSGRPVLAAAERLANHVADRILVNSRAVARDIMQREKAPEKKISLIYNGVDIERFEGISRTGEIRAEFNIPRNAHLIGTISNLRTVKGLNDLVDAAALVGRANPLVRFLIVGRDDGEGDKLRRRVEAAGASAIVQFAGSRDEIPQILSEIDLLVQPSLSEGFSNVILEGMAAGKPVIATNVGGNPEAIDHEVSGLLVPPHAPQEIAKAILRLLEMPDLASQLGANARARVERDFSIQRMLAEMEQMYAAITSGDRQRQVGQ